jgi:hypothetical protein
MSADLKQADRAPAGRFGQTVGRRLVLLRRARAPTTSGRPALNPVHLIVAGVIGALLFVLALVLLVRWVSAAASRPEPHTSFRSTRSFRGEPFHGSHDPAGSTPVLLHSRPSRHPVLVALGLFFVILGAGQWVNGAGWGAYSLLAGLVIWLTCCSSGSARPSRESESGLYSDRIDLSSAGA